MSTIAEQNQQNTDLMYELLQEGKLDLMYLPAGVIAWLWDRPDPQVNAARDLAVAAKDISPVVDGSVLRSDQNILILKTEDGHKFNVYPSGGYGCEGESMDIHGCLKMLDGGDMMVMKDCPMEGGDHPDHGQYFNADNTAIYTITDMKQDDPTALQADPPADGEMVDMDGQFFADDEVGEDIGDDGQRQRQSRMVDTICKVHSLGNPLAKALAKTEGEGEVEENTGAGASSTGWAGMIGTDMFDGEDEIPEIEAMVAEQMNRYGRDKVFYDTVTFDLEDEDTGDYVGDVRVMVSYMINPEEYYTSTGQRKTDYDIDIEGVHLDKPLSFRGEEYSAGMQFPGWLIGKLPFNVLNRRNPGESMVDVFHSYLADKIQAGEG